MPDQKTIMKHGIGTDGMGIETMTRYPAENAPVKKHGGNDAIHNGIRTMGGKGEKVDKLSDGFGK